MPGSYVRPPSAAEAWTLAEWVEYRDRHAAACERWPAWAENVGRRCVLMAEAAIRRLSTETALDPEGLSE